MTLIVPFAAGGTTDVGLRALAAATEKHLGQSIVVGKSRRRRRGAGTLANGGEQRARRLHHRANPDHGVPLSVHTKDHVRSGQRPELHSEPVGLHLRCCGQEGRALGDAPGFLADAKANPGKVSYGTPGAGTTLHITMEQIAKQRDLKWTHVPFRGTSESTSALLGGHISAVADASGRRRWSTAGKLRLLTIWTDQRSKRWPDVPTLQEAGIDMVSNSPFGIAGPKGMDPEGRAKILHDAFKKGMDEQSIADLGQDRPGPFYLNTEDYRAFVVRTVAQQSNLMEELGFKPNSLGGWSDP